jgi:hypothetical protein
MHQGVISSFRRRVAENCALLGYYSAKSGNFLPMHQVLMVVKTQEKWEIPEAMSAGVLKVVPHILKTSSE